MGEPTKKGTWTMYGPGDWECECGTASASQESSGRERHNAHHGTVDGKCAKAVTMAAAKARRAARKAAGK